MQEVAIHAGAVNLFYLLLAVIAWWGLLRLLDIIGGQRFTNLWKVLHANSVALAIYLGCRAIAVAWLVGFALF